MKSMRIFSYISFVLLVLTLFIKCNHQNKRKQDSSVAKLDTISVLKSTKQKIEIDKVYKIGIPYLSKGGDTLCVVKDSMILIKGIIRFSGLNSVDSELFNIKSQFQVESENKSFFLVSNIDMSQYIGRYVCVLGKYIDGWDFDTCSKDGRSTYERTAIQVYQVKLLPWKRYNLQHIGLDISKINVNQNIDSLVGEIKFMKRFAPDINYDFCLKSQTPIIIPEDAYGSEISELPLELNYKVTRPNILIHLIENNKKVKLYGTFNVGYAENFVFKVIDLDTINIITSR